MRAPWQAEGQTKADLDPLVIGFLDAGGGASNYTLLRSAQRLYASAAAPGFSAWRYVRPHGPLYHEVEVPGCDSFKALIPSSAGNASFSPGQMVSVGTLRTGAVILGQPPGGLLGASGFSISVDTGGAFDDLAVTSTTPELVAGLNDQALTLSGLGFNEDPVDIFTASIWDDDEASATFGQYLPDPYVTLHDPTWVDSETVTILADVLSTCPPDYYFGLTWERA